MAKRKDTHTTKLFADGQELFDESYEQQLKEEKQKKVECLGQTFENDTTRREYFTNKLRQGLEGLHERLAVAYEDPEQAFGILKSVENWPMGDDARLRKLAEKMRFTDDSDKDILQRWKDEIGFPHGEIDDILNLSDSPYYTACPNPFLGDVINYFGKEYDPLEDYRCEPFAADVSEGKYDPLYKIHAYPTKVPYKAIMRYILHYTKPNDSVFDGFSGTGMTGVAAMMCNSKKEIEALESSEGYKVGPRYALLADLSTNGTHIASTYNTPQDFYALKKILAKYLKGVKSSLGWVYETKCNEKKQNATINYTVWSEVFVCDNCSKDYSYWDASVSYKPGQALGKVNKVQICPHCGASGTRRNITNATETIFDPILKETVTRKKHVPVLINYTTSNGRLEKFVEKEDITKIEAIKQEIENNPLYRTAPIMHAGEKWGDLQREYHLGITHAHHFFSERNLFVMGFLFSELEKIPEPYKRTIRFILTSTFNRITSLVRYMPQYKERNVGPLSGTLYKPMLFGELNIINVLRAKAKRAIEGLDLLPKKKTTFITTQSSNYINNQVKANSIDYIFTDPPFGDNLPYAELNFNEETWLGVFTNIKNEAIVSKTRGNDVRGYQDMMYKCFESNYYILKPGHWMTVVFHNSKNAVWNAIQESISHAGFVIADVRVLDKKRGTTKQQVYTSGAVKQDLVISAYKPNGGLESRFQLEAGTEEGVWDFIRTHLKQLPVFVSKDGQVEVVAERQSYLLFDRMVAFHVQRGVTVPLSAAEFYSGLKQRFAERDDMYFLPQQAAEYDKKRMKVRQIMQLQLFVTDEASAIQWLRQQLLNKSQTFQEIHPQFIKEIGGWNKNEKSLELSELLQQNFLKHDGKSDVPSQIHSYLSTNFKELRNLPKDDPALQAKAKERWYVANPNKAVDLEKMRDKALLREFDEYRQTKQKRLKVFRLEAVRAGFKKAYQDREYQTIIDIAEKIPEATLQEDQKLLMWYDQAITRTGA